MSNRRGKSQARRHGSSQGLPGWAWLVIGVLVTLLAVLLVPRFLRGDGDGFLRPKADPNALPPAVAEGEAIAPDTAAAGDPDKRPDPAKPGEKTAYDFYTLLPGEGTPMTDAELAASARAEAEAQQRAAAAAAAAAATGVTPGLPDPVDPGGNVTPSSASSTPAAPAATPATPAARVADASPRTPSEPASSVKTPSASADASAATASSTAADARYILQAGAFGASGDAEAVKARIALLGLNARVESAQIGGKTVYRVRMGPYESATELADAKAKLTGGGLPAVAVKAR